VHQLNARQHICCGTERLESEHGSSVSFDRSVVFFDGIVRVPDLANLNRNVLVFNDLIVG
jgi:hypothetical protein